MPALPIESAGILLVGIVPNPYMTEKGRDERICRIPHTTMTNWKRQELQAQIDLMNDIMQIADSAERGISDKGKISPQIQRGRTIARAQEHMSMIDLLTAEQEEHFNDR